MKALASCREASLLRVGVHIRLISAFVVIVMLWLAVTWALQGKA